MMSFAAAQILGLAVVILAWLAGIAVIMLLLWLVIRSAVRSALWKHHERVAAEQSQWGPRTER